jgi:hypothetical protein
MTLRPMRSVGETILRTHGRAAHGVDCMMPTRHVPAMIFALVTLATCAAREAPSPEIRVDEFHPPPPPGFSITHSIMCACTACSPRSCCRGASSDQESACVTHDAGVECSMNLESCTPRCARFTWRVPASKSCDERRPQACCEGS